MAGRYSKEYKPNEFVKLPFEEVAKVMAMKEQKYQQGYLAHAAYQQEMGKQEDRAIDVDYSNYLMDNAKAKVEDLVQSTYNGDYGEASSDILRTLSNEANNPYYKMRKKLVEGEKLERDLEMKLNADGKALAFKKDYTNKAYWDKDNNRANTEFVSDIQGELQHDDEMMKAWKDVMTQQHQSTEQSYEQAYNGGKGVKTFGNNEVVSTKTTAYNGISPDQYKHDQPGAYQRYKQSTSYKQLKRQLSELENNGKEISDEQADSIIRSRFNKIGEPLVQWDPSVSYKDNVTSVNNSSKKNGKDELDLASLKPEQVQESRDKNSEQINKQREETINKAKDFFYRASNKTSKDNRQPIEIYKEKQKVFSASWNAWNNNYNEAKANIDNVDKKISDLQKKNKLFDIGFDNIYSRIASGGWGKPPQMNDSDYNEIVETAKQKNTLEMRIKALKKVEPTIDNVTKQIKQNKTENTYKNQTINNTAPSVLKAIGLDDDAISLFNEYKKNGNGSMPFDEFINDYHDIKLNQDAAMTNLYYYNSDAAKSAFKEAINAGTGKGLPVTAYKEKNGKLEKIGTINFETLKGLVSRGLSSDDKDEKKSNVTFLNNTKGLLDVRIGKNTYSVNPESLPEGFKNSYKGLAEAEKIFNSYSIKNVNKNVGAKRMKTSVPIAGLPDGYKAYATIIPGNKNNVIIEVMDLSGNIVAYDDTKTYADIIESYNKELLSHGLSQNTMNIPTK